MPHATYAYPFEFKIFGFADELSQRLSGGERSFLLIFDENGAARSLYFEHGESSWHDLTRKLESAEVSFLFYDPFEAPEFYWLSWNKVDRPTMERLIGEAFMETDFMVGDPFSPRQPDTISSIDYPMTWGVMF